MSISSQDYIGTFRLLAPIRTGRYTQVWAAIDDVEQRYAAVKLLLPDFRTDADQFRTMRHELEVGRLLDHPHCLGPYDLRQSKQGPCLLMELVRGYNLRDLVKNRRTELLRRFRSIVCQAAEGVAHLNSLRLLHLDIKPDNFIYGPTGEVRLIDFALARRLLNAWERFFWKQRHVPIQGTRSYLSPEQIRREPIDLRSDVYSFGCMLYQLIAGVAPYTGATSNELLARHLHAPIPNVAVDNPAASADIAELLRAMMAKTPQGRPASVAEVAPLLATIRFWKAGDPAAEAEEVANPAVVVENAG